MSLTRRAFLGTPMRPARDGRRFSDKIDPLLHAAAGRVRRWPETDRFQERL